MQEYLLSKILIIPAMLIGFTFHEYAHAFLADKLGDKTPRYQGRLTLNPFAHIDIIGFLSVLLVGFGWAKPVETNPTALKNYYKDDLKISIAGPLMNLFIAMIFSIISVIVLRYIISSTDIGTASRVLYSMLEYVVTINIMLFVFNLIPIPGLDGFHILRDLFPRTFYKVSDFLYRYNLLILILFIFPVGNTSIADIIVGVPSKIIYGILKAIALKIVGF